MKSFAQFLLIVVALVALAFSTAAVSQWAGGEVHESDVHLTSPATVTY